MADAHATAKVRPGPLWVSALVLDGKGCGLLKKVSGGAIAADVVLEHAGPGQPVKKHLGTVHYEEFELQIGFAMGPPVFDWIAAAWRADPKRHDGSVVSCDEKLEAKSERKFTGALLTETTIPTLDAGSQEPAWLTVKFAPELVRTAKASGKVSGADPHHPEKLLFPSGFKLEIDGLDCAKVRKIGSFTVRQPYARDDFGDASVATLEPGALSFPDLEVTFAEVAVDSWLDWFEDFVVRGNSTGDKEKSGTLTLLSPNQQPLASIKLFNLGIFRLGAIDSAVDSDRLKLATAGLYCERMELKLGA